MQYNNSFVDEKYSGILEPNLFADEVLIPGITYNDEHQVDAASGRIYIYKETKAAKGDPSTPAGDFTNENTSNSLIPITLNNAYRKSKKIYQVTANSVSYPLAETNLALAVNENREDRQFSAIGCLANESTKSANTTALTAQTIKDQIIADRKTARKAFANPDIVLCSPDAYATILAAAGSQFTPIMNDRIAETANVGRWLGFIFVEANAIQGSVKYYDDSNVLRTVNLDNVEYIMYDHRTFHVVDNLQAMRVIDSESFTGVLAQNEINTGFKVSNPAKVLVKTKGALVAGTQEQTNNPG